MHLPALPPRRTRPKLKRRMRLTQMTGTDQQQLALPLRLPRARSLHAHAGCCSWTLAPVGVVYVHGCHSTRTECQDRGARGERGRAAADFRVCAGHIYACDLETRGRRFSARRSSPASIGTERDRARCVRSHSSLSKGSIACADERGLSYERSEIQVEIQVAWLLKFFTSQILDHIKNRRNNARAARQLAARMKLAHLQVCLSSFSPCPFSVRSFSASLRCARPVELPEFEGLQLHVSPPHRCVVCDRSCGTRLWSFACGRSCAGVATRQSS